MDLSLTAINAQQPARLPCTPTNGGQEDNNYGIKRSKELKNKLLQQA